jgi:outer membrane biosynthesis protein TonB
VRQVISNIQSLGAAGAVAMSSATYFQAETVVDSTEQVSAIIQEVEIDYDQTFANYFVESVALAINDIPVIESIPVVGSALESVSEGLLEVADNMETVEEKQERVAQEQAEAEAKAEAKAEVKAEAEKQEAKEHKSEEKSEQNSEEVKEEKSEPQQETEEQKSEPQNKESESRDSSQESAETQSESDVESEEASQDSSQDAPEVVEDIPVDQDMDEIKPHSMVQSDDAGGFIDQPDFPRVETPFDATIVSPNGPARPVSPVN